jgi:hypothetical protein
LSTEAEPAGATPACPQPIDQVERWPIERLIPCPNNLRLHSAADLDKIAAAIVEWGGRIPVLADQHHAFGQSRDERAPRQDDDQSGAAHGAKSFSRH